MATLSEKTLFSREVLARFPSTRYQGSKTKLTQWIWSNLKDIDFHTCLDAFGGTGAVAYRLKLSGKQVTYNDLLTFNYYFGKALIENDNQLLTDKDISWVLTKHDGIRYPTFIQDTFRDVYYTHEENIWLDQAITNISQLTDPYCFALAFYALAQACIVKRPYNLFHRKNLYVRLANVKRNFGNKTSWDKPFVQWFKKFAKETNKAVFKGDSHCTAINTDALEVQDNFDLVYIDTPYISKKGVAVDYADFYHFLEGLCYYDQWAECIDHSSKHLRMKRKPNPWCNQQMIHKAFEELFAKFSKSVIVVSYRSDGIPSINELSAILGKYKSKVHITSFGQYKYVLSKNGKSKEVLLIGI